MKIMFYTLRPFDELTYAEKFRGEYGIDFNHTVEYPNAENMEMARGC